MKRALISLLQWFDTSSTQVDADRRKHIDWVRVFPFVAMHVMCLGIFWVGWSPVAVITALGLYALRMFAITGFYHRYFSHKAFKTSRPVQFVFGLLGSASVQRGPLWWAAHHRHHHVHSDTEADIHSPVTNSFWRSHMGWFLTHEGFQTHWDRIKDLARFPELRVLDRFDLLVPVALAIALFAVGGFLESRYPGLETSAAQMLIWGFFISTTVLFHATVTINSFAHRFGRRRFDTRDNSRNNWILALITFGEGWHNNHHFFPGSARQGFRWWEIDLTYYMLRIMASLGLIWDLKTPPERAVSR